MKKPIDKRRKKSDTPVMSTKRQVQLVLGLGIALVVFLYVILLTGEVAPSPSPVSLPSTQMPMLSKPVRPMVIVRVTYPDPPYWVSLSLIKYINDEANNPRFKTKIPILLIYKLIEWESTWDQRKHNNNYKDGKLVSVDIGLTMLNSLYTPEFIHDYKDPWRKASSYDVVHNPFDNVQIGMRRLRAMYDIFGTWTDAVAAYNAGITTVALRWKLPAPTVKEVSYVIPVEGWWDAPEGIEIVYNKH